MPGIKVREGESFDEAYRKFKKQTDRNLVVTECRARRFFESKTEKRKKQKINAKTTLYVATLRVSTITHALALGASLGLASCDFRKILNL